MKKTALIMLILALAFPAQGAKFKRVVGEKFPEVKVKDVVSGEEIDLSAQMQEPSVEAVVVVFTSYTCPVAQAYEERLNELVKEYGQQVLFLALNANAATENEKDQAQYVKEKGLLSHYAMDAGSKVAKQIGASVTPETYLLDKKGTIVYHGPIDDSQDPQQIENHLLRVALKDLLNREVQAFGCQIKVSQ